MKKLLILLVVVGFGLSCGWSMAWADPIETPIEEKEVITPQSVDKSTIQAQLDALKADLATTEESLRQLQNQRTNLTNRRLMLLGAIETLQNILKE